MKNNVQHYFITADLGNSTLTLALFKDFQLIKRKEIAEDKISEKKISDLFKSWKTRKVLFSSVVFSSVNNAKKKVLQSIFEKIGCEVFSIKSLVDKEVFKKYASFAKLGDDRVANISYCQHFLRCPSVVLDSGTTINIDVFDGKLFQGGYIISGSKLEMDAVQVKAKGTALKGKALLQASTLRPGLSTKECLERGILLSKEAFAIAAICEVKRTIRKRTFATVLTGGNAKSLKPLSIFDIVDKNITLKGMAAAFFIKWRLGQVR